MARLLFFGKLGDLAGEQTRELDLPDNVSTVERLIAEILQIDTLLGAALSDMSIRFIVNEEIVQQDHGITNNDEIAFLPPVSGG